MSTGNARVAALATFGALAIFYLGSVIINFISWGWAWTLEAARAESALAYSLTLRIIGGVISLILFVLCAGHRKMRRVRTFLAWLLALGVSIVLVIDIFAPPQTVVSSEAVVWLIAAGIIVVHLFGAIAAQRVTPK